VGDEWRSLALVRFDGFRRFLIDARVDVAEVGDVDVGKSAEQPRQRSAAAPYPHDRDGDLVRSGLAELRGGCSQHCRLQEVTSVHEPSLHITLSVSEGTVSAEPVPSLTLRVISLRGKCPR